jgi:anaphase-promoting complex subunit 5
MADSQCIVDTDTGCEKLAVIEENIVTAFSEVGGDSNDAIIVTLNHAYRVRIITFRQGIP